MYILYEEIKELKKIHKEETGEELTDAEAQDVGERLMQLCEVIIQPLPLKTAEEEKEALAYFAKREEECRQRMERLHLSPISETPDLDPCAFAASYKSMLQESRERRKTDGIS